MKINLPNIAGLSIKKLGVDQYLRDYGLKKILRSKSFEEGKNGELNRYLMHIQDRLRYLAVNRPEDFWKLGMMLLTRSKALRLLALRNVRPNWYKDLSNDQIMRELRKLNGICYRPSETFRIKRTGIPKPDGSTRFINDPGLAWRLYLWMFNFILGIYMKTRISDSQHGHRSDRGSMTCWKEILDTVPEYNYIYELDYTKFHDNIKRAYLKDSLLEIGIPEEVTRKCIHLCSAYVKGVDPRDPMTNVVWPGNEYQHFYHGVVQGSNIAGLMGLAVLEKMKVYYQKDFKYIGYADDALLFMHDPKALEGFLPLLESKESGVTLKEAKSGWVRVDGEWVKDLKFVGARLSQGRDLFAATHSGKEHHFRWEHKPVKEEVKARPWTIGESLLSDEEKYGYKSGLSDEMRAFFDTLRKERCRKGVSPTDKAGKIGPDLTWKNGQRYMGFLFSKIWSDYPYTNEEKKINKMLLGVKNCFMYLMGTSTDLVTASTWSFTALKLIYREHKELSKRPERICHKERSERARLVDFGAFRADEIIYLSENEKSYLIGTDNPRPTPYMLSEGENFVLGNLLAKWGPSMTALQRAFASKEILKVNQSLRKEWLSVYSKSAPRFNSPDAFKKATDSFYDAFYTNTKLHVRRV